MQQEIPFTQSMAAGDVPATAVASLMGTIGSDGFIAALLGFARPLTGADFVSVFCCGDRDTPLLIGTESALGARRAQAAAKGYARHFRADRNAALLTDPAAIGDYLTLQTADDIGDAAYRRDCYTMPGLVARLSFIRRRARYGLSVSLYRGRENAPFSACERDAAAPVLAVMLAACERHIAFALRDAPWQSNDMLTRLALTFPKLTEREAEVVAMSLKGRTAAQIAAILGLGETTVITHRKKAYQRLNVSGMRALMARLNGLGARDDDRR